MRNKWHKDGLVAISVNLDPEYEKEKDRVIKFLEKGKATTINVHLDEDADFWGKKFENDGSLPTVFVFNRAGKYVRFPSPEKPDFDYGDIEKVVVEFLKEK